MKHIAVIGSGIAGLSAAYVLSRRHLVHLFEKDQRLGGHTHTVTVENPRGPQALDTGFLVHNDRTYPNLVRLLAEIGVETQASDMCFSVSCPRTGLEYSSRGARGFFAQRSNVLKLGHLLLLKDILRFNRDAPALLAEPGAETLTLGDFLDFHRFAQPFRQHYLFPMASAIWSASLGAIRCFPAATLIRFLDNHGLLSVSGQPKWKTIRGGSQSYIPKLTAPLGGRVFQGVQILGVRRGEQNVTVTVDGKPPMHFDEVVFACHGDEVLPLLLDPSDAERQVFDGFRTTTNTAWLHTDVRMLPALPDARASWNYRLADNEQEAPGVTYHLNRLQQLTTDEQFMVTLNPVGDIDERRVLRKMVYTHPMYTREAIHSQARWAEVSGRRRTHYCGADWFYGFHEDGLRSALRVASALGVDW